VLALKEPLDKGDWPKGIAICDYQIQTLSDRVAVSLYHDYQV
jgi:hypothetical protein